MFLQESHRVAEAAFDKSGRTLTLTIIRQGFNSSRQRYYTVEALRSGVTAFANAQQYLNHPTEAETAARPEGDIRDWVASLDSVVYDEASQSLRGTAKIIDPDFLEKVALMDEQGLLQSLGVSVRAMGSGAVAEVDGHQTFRVDEFVEGISVDFVTRPGAGGFVEFRESDTSTTEDDMSAEAIAAAERRAVEAEQRAKEAEESAKGALKRAEEAEAKVSAAEAAIESLKAQEAHRASQEAIGKCIDEADLPAESKARLRVELANESDVDTAKTRITEHAEYIAKLLSGTRTTGLGESAPAGETNMAESFKAKGYDESIAKILAGVN